MIKIKENSRYLNKAFSLIELSIVILIIGILVAGVTQSSRLMKQFKLSSAQSITRSSDINSILDLVFWAETTLDNSLTNSSGSFQMEDGNAISQWSDINFRSNPKINLVQANTNNQPIYKSSGINGLPSISFDGVNDNLFSTATTPLPALHPYNIYLQIKSLFYKENLFFFNSYL
jgi:prepilin-type N-terminal cleavage/methylation domain-containing protein